MRETPEVFHGGHCFTHIMIPCKMTDYGRSRKRNPDHGKGRAVLYLLSVLVLCFLILFLLGEVFPEVKQKETDLLRRVGIARGIPETEAADSFAGEDPGEAPVPSAAMDEDPEEDVTGQQVIGVAVKPEEKDRETAAAEPETEPETEPPGPITLLFAGDILFDPHYAIMASMLERSPGRVPDITTAFDEATLSVMRGADLFMLNNEFPYTDRGKPTPEKQYTFRASPAYATLLKDMGADLVALANNHMYDHGEVSLLDTLDTLSGIGLPYVGAGRDLSEAAAPFYYTSGDFRIGLISATQIERMGNPDTKGATETSPGVFRCMNSEKLLEVIREMKDECDFVVAYLHWGTEGTEKVDDWQRKLAKDVAEAGADLIIGDHPHVLQGIDTAGGVPVIYSLGNYLFNSKAQDTCLFEAVVDPVTSGLLSLRFLPCRQEGCRTKLLSGPEKQRVIEYMRTQSGVSIDDEGYIR